MKSVGQSKKTNEFPKVQDAHFIQKSNGLIKGYSVNTFHGMVKTYNEDRVSIIMNITKPHYKGRWPKCSYFAIFDGHGGSACSDFLKDNMHKYITQNQHFPHKPIEALKQGFKNAQNQFLKLAQSKSSLQRSGSCALVLLVIDQTCYVANVGDSRAILSTNLGKNAYPVSRDHKPDSPTQRTRILQAGGNIYQSSVKKNGNIIYGPHRIEPGKLSVSRAFGDIEAKMPQFGGNPKVLIAKPQITYFTIDPNQHDFIMMGSDGIFDKMQNQQIIQQFWNLQTEALKQYNHQKNSQKLTFIGKAASQVINKAMQNTSMDNLTTLFVIFQNSQKFMQPCYNSMKKQKQNIMDLRNHIQAHGQNRIKSQRSKSINNQQKNGLMSNSNMPESQKFSLKRQISKNNLIQHPKTFTSKSVLKDEQKQQSQQNKQKSFNKIHSNSRQQDHRQQNLNTNNKNSILRQNNQKNQLNKNIISHRQRNESFENNRTNNSNNRNQQQQNVQLLANRQNSVIRQKQKVQSTSGSNSMYKKQTEVYRNIQNKFNSNVNINPNMNQIISNYRNDSINSTQMNGITRKKSQGLLRKDSKKESVWNSISRGLKNNQKIEKIRY